MSETLQIKRLRTFVVAVYQASAGGPPGQGADELLARVEDGTLNSTALHYMLAGFKFESFSAPPLYNADGRTPLPEGFGGDSLDDWGVTPRG